MAESLGHKATTGAIWASIDRFGIMVLQFVVNLILARLLLPQDFGAVGMLAIFIAVSQVLIDGGLVLRLSRKRTYTNRLFDHPFLEYRLFIGPISNTVYLRSGYIRILFNANPV